jgi:Ca2+-binding RTX toxin-like protein
MLTYIGTGSFFAIGNDQDNNIVATAGSGHTIYGMGGDDGIFSGDGDDALYGDDGNDVIYAGGGNDRLEGGAGADILLGMTGDDTYYVDRAGEVFESANEGNDTVVAGFDYTLDANVENLILIGAATRGTGNWLNNVITGTIHDNYLDGGAGDDTLNGGDGSDTLVGGDGNDTLNGGNGNDRLLSGTGVDIMIGGAGDDEYWVSDARAQIVETSGNGNDALILGVSYTLAAGVSIERVNMSLRPVGHALNDLPINFTGNEFAQLIDATDGANIIRGGGGGDTIRAFGGDDIIYGDEGSDTIDGGAGNDIIEGGEGSDFLTGGAGVDILRGGIGNDNYYVDRNGEVFENAGEGIDSVFANLAGGMYTLDANVENLTLQGTTFYGVGNELSNQITGSASTNWLMGGDGDDWLNGMGGDDVLYGDAGADTFVFGRGTGVDTVADFRSGTDKLYLAGFGFADFAAVLAATQDDGSGNSFIDLGGGDRVVLRGVTKAQLASGDVVLGGGAAALALDAGPGLIGEFDHLFDNGPELVRIGVVHDDAMLIHNLI